MGNNGDEKKWSNVNIGEGERYSGQFGRKEEEGSRVIQRRNFLLILRRLEMETVPTDQLRLT